MRLVESFHFGRNLHPKDFKGSSALSLVEPNLYCVWSTSMEPRSFSEAFFPSMNCPSGIALAFKILYLLTSGRQSENQSSPNSEFLFVKFLHLTFV